MRVGRWAADRTRWREKIRDMVGGSASESCSGSDWRRWREEARGMGEAGGEPAGRGEWAAGDKQQPGPRGRRGVAGGSPPSSTRRCCGRRRQFGAGRRVVCVCVCERRDGCIG